MTEEKLKENIASLKAALNPLQEPIEIVQAFDLGLIEKGLLVRESYPTYEVILYENPTSKKIKEKGLQLIKKYPEYRMSIHWCEMLSVFPVFMDITTIIGKLAVYEDKFTTSQIRQKLYDEYGERAAILHSSAKLLQTIKDMGAIKQVKTGVYNIQKTKISKPDVVDYMLFTLMQCSQSSYRTVEQLGDFKALFPFDYQVSREQIQMDDDFVYSTFGNEITVALKVIK